MKGEGSKFVVVMVSLAAIVASILVFSALQKPARAGELAFDVENVDVGTVPLGQTVVQRFPMQNVGDAPVTITRRQVAVLEGCWPPNPVVSVTTLAPGKRAEVMIAPSMHEGMDGQHLFEVTIETDSTTRPVQKLYLRANWKKWSATLPMIDGKAEGHRIVQVAQLNETDWQLVVAKG